MSETKKRGRGRPPKDSAAGAMTAADRQALYAAARARDMGEVAFALKTALARSRTERKAFVEVYRGTPSGERLRRGLITGESGTTMEARTALAGMVAAKGAEFTSERRSQRGPRDGQRDHLTADPCKPPGTGVIVRPRCPDGPGIWEMSACIRPLQMLN